MKRRLHNLLTALSLLLGAVVVALWVLGPVLASSRNHTVRLWPDGSQWSWGIGRRAHVRFCYWHPTAS